MSWEIWHSFGSAMPHLKRFCCFSYFLTAALYYFVPKSARKNGKHIFYYKNKRKQKEKRMWTNIKFSTKFICFFHSLKLSKRTWRFKIRVYPIEENACFLKFCAFETEEACCFFGLRRNGCKPRAPSCSPRQAATRTPGKFPARADDFSADGTKAMPKRIFSGPTLSKGGASE